MITEAVVRRYKSTVPCEIIQLNLGHKLKHPSLLYITHFPPDKPVISL